jgi:serine/threonine protein kinase
MSQTSPQTNASHGQSLPTGTRLEEFVIERVLGSGGFGITYLARDSSLGRRVVIKENLPSQFCWRDSHALTVRPRHTEGEDADNFQYSLESFRKEAATLASLDHPGIVKVLRSFEANGTAYFVMPFVEGTALDEVIRQRASPHSPFSEAEIQDLLAKMLDALGYLHERGIYHRDLKPGNILMTKAGPVLIDFGAARQRLSERSLTVIESAGYTPFEQLQSRGKIGPWSDLYALGGTLYKTITGETPAKANDRAFDDPVVPLAKRAELHGRYSSQLLSSIDKAMAPKIAERLQDAGQWRDSAKSSSVAPKHNDVRPPPLPGPVQVQRSKVSTSARVSLTASIGAPIDPTPPQPVQMIEHLKREATKNHLLLLDYEEQQRKAKAQKEYKVLVVTVTVVTIGIWALWHSVETPDEESAAVVTTSHTLQETHVQRTLEADFSLDKAAAEAGDIDAQFRMGISHLTGRGTPQDDRQAITWFERAAASGHEGAKLQLKFLFASETALNGDRIAAESGDINAQFRMGIAHLTGRDAPRDEQLAIKWFKSAAARGHEGAKLQLRYLEPQR